MGLWALCPHLTPERDTKWGRSEIGNMVDRNPHCIDLGGRQRGTECLIGKGDFSGGGGVMSREM